LKYWCDTAPNGWFGLSEGASLLKDLLILKKEQYHHKESIMNLNDFDEVLIFAISNEVEAEEFYKEAAEKLADPFLKDLFSQLSKEERRHQRILQGFRDKTPEDFHFKKVPDFHVADTLETPKLSTDMKPADAFALAVKKEEEAMKQYTQMAESTSDAAMKNTFQELAAMEREHKMKMENAFVDIGFPEVW